jgi:hypothetical protein
MFPEVAENICYFRNQIYNLSSVRNLCFHKEKFGPNLAVSVEDSLGKVSVFCELMQHRNTCVPISVIVLE